MGNCVIAWPNADLEANMVLTSSSAVSTLPASNLLTNQPTTPHRIDGITSSDNAWIKIDLGTTYLVKYVGLHGVTGVTNTTQWKILGDNTEAGVDGGSPDHTISNLEYHYKSASFYVGPNYNDRMTSFTKFSAAGWAATRWIKILPRDSTVTELDIGRVIIGINGLTTGIHGNVFQPDINMAYGVEYGLVDPSTANRSLGSNTYVMGRPQLNMAKLTLENLTADEVWGPSTEDGAPGIVDLDRETGAKVPVAFVANPDATRVNEIQRTTIYGLCKPLQPIQHPVYETFSKRYTITEMI